MDGRGKKNPPAKKTPPSSSVSPHSTTCLDNEWNTDHTTVIHTSPTNILTTLISSFAYSIDTHNMDTRHNLAWNFGDFIYDVPRWLGSNAALDAAADALVASHSHFCRTRYSNANELCLEKYSRALRALRITLSTMEQACEPATLCAIMIIMMTEVGICLLYLMIHIFGRGINC